MKRLLFSCLAVGLLSGPMAAQPSQSQGQAVPELPFESVKFFQLPPDLPFSIETVRSGNDFVRIDGEVSWKGTSSPPAVAPLD